MANLKVGDAVQLKAGLQAMTVNNISGKRITCVWHDAKVVLKREVFYSDALKLVDVEKKPPLPFDM